MLLFTAGYEGRSLEEFTEMLLENGVALLVDVRARPYSRKRGFSRKELQHHLGSAGIGYIHLESLGAPDNLRRKVRGDGNYQEFFTLYRKHLLEQKESLEKVIELTGRETICLMCYERNPDYCHRTAVAGEVSKRSPGKIELQSL